MYRDDRDALLARLAVLEREAKQADELRARVADLEQENHRLREEVEALRPPPPPPPYVPSPPTRHRPLRFRVSDHTGSRDVDLALPIIKVGKLPSSHLRLADDDRVSRIHAVIEVNPDSVVLIDLGSTTGTVVNGHQVNKTELRHGDEIRIGPNRIVIAIGDAG